VIGKSSGPKMDKTESLHNHNEIAFAAPDGIVAINKEKKIISFSEAAQRLTGYQVEDVISKDITFIFGEPEENIQLILDALSTGNTYSNISMDIKCANGKSQNFLTSVTPLVQPSQNIIGVIVVFRNTEEMVSLFNVFKEKSREILDEKNKLEAIFNSRWEGTFTIDRNWTVTSFNHAAERITGYSSKAAVGKKCWDIFRSILCRHGCHMEFTMKKQKPATSEELMIIHREGHKIPIRVNSAPLYDGEKKYIGAVETFLDISEIKNLSSQLEERFQFQNIIGQSRPMLKVYDLMENVVQSDSTVLITGESGTGKEIIARAIHLNSQRKTAPFMAVNCSAFAETLLESELFGHEKGAFTGAIRTKTGRLELAGDGTLFIDEIGDISLPIQVKLLRVLENRQYERVGGTNPLELKARIITATNKNLEKEVKEGKFREDLYYRINVINIFIPPLRERMEDMPLLVNYFIEKFQKKFNKDIKSISPSAFTLLKRYEWQGNIRELENVLEHAFVVCQGEVIETEHLPERIWPFLESKNLTETKGGKELPLKNAEKLMIINTLGKFSGHRGRTAEALGIDKTTLWRKMKKYQILK